MESNRQNLLTFSKINENNMYSDQIPNIFKVNTSPRPRQLLFSLNDEMVNYVIDDLKTFKLDENFHNLIHFLELKIEKVKESSKFSENEKKYYVDLLINKYNSLKDEKRKCDNTINDFKSNINYYEKLLLNLYPKYLRNSKEIKNKSYELGCEIQKDFAERGKKFYLWTREIFQKLVDASDYISELNEKIDAILLN